MKDSDIPSFLRKPPAVTIRNRRTGEVVRQLAVDPGTIVDLGPDEYVEILPDNLKTPLVLEPGETAEALPDVERFADAALRLAKAVTVASESLAEVAAAMLELVESNPEFKEED